MRSTRSSTSTIPHRIKALLHVDLFSVPLILLLLIINICLTLVVINFRAYTEIDWEAYMQQVDTFLSGQRDYLQIRGGTGPLVYPAGFVYFYTALYKLTERGTQIETAQYFFAFLHTLSLLFVLLTYRKVHYDCLNRGQYGINKIFVIALLCSRRLMSIYVLRLFNDGVQATLIYASILFFSYSYFIPAFILYSLSLSIKMNALLYLPAIAVITSQSIGFLRFFRWTIFLILSQIALAIPFLRESPHNYISRAFEFSRVFLYKWSLNGSFLSEEIFTGKQLALSLLLAHLVVLLLFGHFRWTSHQTDGLFRLIGLHRPFIRTLKQWKTRLLPQKKPLSPLHVVMMLYSCNFIGIVYARTLHYQFYAWYAQTLPLLVSQTSAPIWIKIGILVAIEAVFNSKSPNAIASVILHVAHFSLIALLWCRKQVNDDTIFTSRPKTN